MCGRVLIGENKEIERQGGVRRDTAPGKVSKTSTGNPGSLLPVVTDAEPTKIQYYRWGLLRVWDNEIHSRCKHARIETLQSVPSFKDLAGRKHCVTKVQGYFEFDKVNKQLYYITTADDSPLYIAGLWDIWLDVDTNVLIPTFTMITTNPDETVGQIHDRMPVLLKRNQISTWLNSKLSATNRLEVLKQAEHIPLKICLATEREVKREQPPKQQPPQPGFL